MLHKQNIFTARKFSYRREPQEGFFQGSNLYLETLSLGEIPFQFALYLYKSKTS